MNNESRAGNLRPRTRRLISHDDEDSSNTDHLSENAPQSQRKQSHRNLSTAPRHDRSIASSGPLSVPSSTSTIATGLWETSWSSLQGFASTLFSGDTFGTSRNSSPRRSQRQSEAARGKRSTVPAQWGPTGGGERHLGRGSREDRLAQVQAKKREALLAANGYLGPDVSGRYKRRDSEDRNASSAPPAEHEDRDALVYLHKVQPTDTLAGVMIKYSCQPNAFKRANRLWPNDSIQVRKVVLLPLEACGVRGRKVQEPTTTLDGTQETLVENTLETLKTSHHPWANSTSSSTSRETWLSSIPSSPLMSYSSAEEPPWKHDSWVMIDGFTEAVEIARLSRRTLGFFPPSRRKSMSFSDLGTPSASLDIPRASSQDVFHRRKESRSSSSSHFAHQLQGPGGVGTLGKGVHNPGPAQDGLNKLFASHLPNVAPRTSFESVTSTSSAGGGLENVGGVIEGWVRKLATKAAARVQSPGPRGTPAVGDLIELTDSFEIGGGDSNPGPSPAAKPSASAGHDDDQERMLREHFPARGRVFGESTRKTNS